jgi:methyl-accepting chemotaxis protein
MSRVQRKLLNLCVKKTFQRWLLIRILGVTLLCSFVAALILYFYSRNEITSSFFDAHIKIRRVSDLLLPVVLAGSFISLASGLILSLFLPQKIAGPIYRIEQDLKTVQEGDLTSHITLRDGDVLVELAEAVNKTTTMTRSRVHESKDALANLIEAMGSGAENSSVKPLIQDLQNALNQLKTK